MKRIKLPALLMALLLGLMLLAGCGGSGKIGEMDTDFDGTWVNAEGDILQIASESHGYTIQRLGGRVGKGSYENYDGVMKIDFYGSLYSLSLDDGDLVIEKDGDYSSHEVLEGPFTRDDSAEIISYSLEDLDGFWSNGEGEMFRIDSTSSMYAYKNANAEAAEGEISNISDGRGLHMNLYGDGDGRAYFIVASDLSSFSLQRFEGITMGEGTFTRIDEETFAAGADMQSDVGGDEAALRESLIEALTEPVIGWVYWEHLGVYDETTLHFEMDDEDGSWEVYEITPDAEETTLYAGSIYRAEEIIEGQSWREAVLEVETGAEYEGEVIRIQYDLDGSNLRIIRDGMAEDFSPDV